MKYFLLFALTPVIMLACSMQNPSQPGPSLMQLRDAETILGEAAQMTDSIPERKGDTLSWRITYMAKAEEQGRRGNVYYMLERYPMADHAHAMYAFIKKANTSNGAQALDSPGDEAYFHTDGTAFYFMLVRKGPWLLRMKVNRITKHTSEASFRAVAKELTDRL